MDKLIYTAMSGAKHALEQQANAANNLANVSTTGFRAQLNTFRAVPIVGDGLATRAFVADSTVGSDFTPGPLQETGRTLDVAVQGKGWLAVEAADGSEAYTRAGDLKTDENGVLQTGNGHNLVGEGGTIAIPPNSHITIAKDGTVSTIPTAGAPNAVQIVGRLKLVNPAETGMTRGDDGLYRMKDGSDAQADANVVLAPGMLEGSNVNPIESMVNMISLAREFELHMKVLQTAESDAAKASSILAL